AEVIYRNHLRRRKMARLVANHIDELIICCRYQTATTRLRRIDCLSSGELTYGIIVLFYGLTQMHSRRERTRQTVVTKVRINNQCALAGKTKGVRERHDDEGLALCFFRTRDQQYARVCALNVEAQLPQILIEACEVGRLRVEEEIPRRISNALGQLRNNSNGRYPRNRLETGGSAYSRIAKLFNQHEQGAKEKAYYATRAH